MRLSNRWEHQPYNTTPKRKVCTNDHDCAAASAIIPENDDGWVLKVGCLVGSGLGRLVVRLVVQVDLMLAHLMPSSNINLIGVISLFVCYWSPPTTMDAISATIVDDGRAICQNNK